MSRDIHVVVGEVERKRRELLDVAQNLAQQIVHMNHFTKAFYGELSFPERLPTDPGANHVFPPPEVPTLKASLSALVQCHQVAAQRLMVLAAELPKYEELYGELEELTEATPG